VNPLISPKPLPSRCRIALGFAALLLVLFVAGCGSSRGLGLRQSLRVMTWNIHHGEGMDKVIDLDRIAQLILDEKADVVALQEVDRGVERSKKIDMITKLADLTGMTYAFGKTIEYQGGDYGNAVLTRFPIFEERNVLFRKFPETEQRGVLLLVLGINGEEVVVASTHFDSRENDSVRSANANDLRSILKATGLRPLIVCGDFNDIPSSRMVSKLKEEYLDSWEQAGTWEGYTFPSDAPRKRIDYIFTKYTRNPDSTTAPTRLKPMAAHVSRSAASDHTPLLVEFELTTER
jgi:endonuclease/exonuclease/phosphatase family metal-dependent hydrolase